MTTGLNTPTARPDLSERAYLLTVPSQATVKFLSVERPLDGGTAEVRCRVIETRRRPDRFPAWQGLKKQRGRLRASWGLLREQGCGDAAWLTGSKRRQRAVTRAGDGRADINGWSQAGPTAHHESNAALSS
jgi:hypothetical protein